MSVCPCVTKRDISIYLHRLMFLTSLSSGDDIDLEDDLQEDKYKDKDTQTQTKTNTKCFQDPIYFSKAGG